MKTVRILKNVVSSNEISQLIEYYNTDNDKDQRPDHQSKNCPMDTKDWPRELINDILKRALGYVPDIDWAFFLEKNQESYTLQYLQNNWW
jgi:hypothetical protein